MRIETRNYLGTLNFRDFPTEIIEFTSFMPFIFAVFTFTKIAKKDTRT